MYDPILSQVIYDADLYQKKINSIEKAMKDLPNRTGLTWTGVPRINVSLDAVDLLEEEILELKKTFIPAMKELIEKIERDEHLKKAKDINKELSRDYSNGL